MLLNMYFWFIMFNTKESIAAGYWRAVLLLIPFVTAYWCGTMVAEISFCPCMLWGKHCLGGAKWFSLEQLYHQDERHTQTYRRSHVRQEIHCNQRAWSVSTAPFWSEGWIENLTSKVRGGCQRGRQQYKKWNNEVRTCRRRDTGEMGHETVFRCAVPQPSALSKCCHLIYTLWLSLMAAPSLQTRRYSSMARIHSMTIEAPITKVSPEQTFPQTPESGVALIGKYVVSEQRSRSFLYFVINRII